MKKLFLVGALTLFGAVNAQTFGLKAGVNVSSVSNFAQSKSKIGFNGGVFMNAPLAASFSIQPEIIYSGKGAKYDGVVEVDMNLDYISVPVMFQYNATPKFYFEAGPEFSFLMSGKLKGEGESVDLKDDLNSFDFGIGLGLGYFFTPNFGINARYVSGITGIIKDNPNDEASKNNVFQIGLAYKFSK
ncbi:porin family protein [Chryseobacterium sp.]|uniref:porin family protein n=1 Tax=Chryseobacterium sp. TaxID=1871047 RepID=UPI0011CC738F|nr:porin family protein [Chryseobacterium sp.]TXF79081.1 PorT family protein [Chryseobacterium sp.]